MFFLKFSALKRNSKTKITRKDSKSLTCNIGACWFLKWIRGIGCILLSSDEE
jgi:hypothetical protein